MTKKPRIINTGVRLPKPTALERITFISNQKKVVTPKIHQQSIKDRTIIYGGEAVNALLPRGLHRPSSDFDVMSKTQKRHAVQLEQHIDKRTGRDMTHVKQLPHPTGMGDLFRVEVRKEDVVLADYSPMKKTTVVVKNGVRYESLSEAEKKYKRMIRKGDRYVKPNQDLARIEQHKNIKKSRLRRLF